MVQDDSTKGATPITNKESAEDRVVRFRTIQNSRGEAIAQKATDTRTKFGRAIAGSILIEAFFPLIALGLFLIAALLIASGKEPQKTQGNRVKNCVTKAI